MEKINTLNEISNQSKLNLAETKDLIKLVESKEEIKLSEEEINKSFEIYKNRLWTLYNISINISPYYEEVSFVANKIDKIFNLLLQNKQLEINYIFKWDELEKFTELLNDYFWEWMVNFEKKLEEIYNNKPHNDFQIDTDIWKVPNKVKVLTDEAVDKLLSWE